jgi:hypothetical protein
VILSAFRRTLRGWLQDTLSGGVQWTDQKLDGYINLGLRETQKHVLTVAPELFKCVYLANTVIPATGEDAFYSFPAGAMALHEVAISSDGVSYVPLRRQGLGTIRLSTAGDIGSVSCWVPFSAKRWILYPPPSTAVTNGLRVIAAPTLVMAGENDSNPLPLAYETLHLKRAQLIALWDVGEPTESVQREIDRMEDVTRRFQLDQMATEPPLITPLISRNY